MGALAIYEPLINYLRETAASENATAYFPLLDRIATGHFSSVATESGLYQTFLDVLREDGHITSAEALATFNLALSLRTAAPRIEAHYQYYSTSVGPEVGDMDDCYNWALVDGHRYCSPSLEVSDTTLPLKS